MRQDVDCQAAQMHDGRRQETTDPQQYVFGQFNSAMKDCFLVNLSEVGGKDVYEAYNKFKALVTDPELWINGKGKEHVKITSYHHWITTTNNEDPLPTDDDDRRAALIRCSDEKVGDTAYFDQMHALLKQLVTLLTFWRYLKARKVKPLLTKYRWAGGLLSPPYATLARVWHT
jgi:hypothetical protein